MRPHQLPTAVIASALGPLFFCLTFPLWLNWSNMPASIAGFWAARCDAFTLAFLATPLQLLDLYNAALDVMVYDVPDIMLDFRRTKAPDGPMDLSFLDLFMGLLHLPLTIALSVVVAVFVVAIKSPALLLRAYIELWGRSTFYGFNPKLMRKQPLLAFGFLLVNVCMPLLLVVVLVWTPLWALWHGGLAAALMPMMALPTAVPLEYFGLPWGYLGLKLLQLNSESNAFIVGSATNLVGVYGMGTASADDTPHVFDYKSAGKAAIVGLLSLVAVPLLVVPYLLAVTPVALLALFVRSIAQFSAEKGNARQKLGYLFMLLMLLPLVLLAMAGLMALSPFLAVLPAQRAYLMCSFAGGFRGILRVVLLLDFKLTRLLYQTDNVLALSVLPRGVWETGVVDQGEEGGDQGPLGKLPVQDNTDRSMIDPMAEHVAAQMQARVYGVRGTMSAAAKHKAAELRAAGLVPPADAPPDGGATPVSTNEDAIDGPAHAVPPHMRKPVRTVYAQGPPAADPGQQGEQGSSRTQSASGTDSIVYDSTTQSYTGEEYQGAAESVVSHYEDSQDSAAPSRTSSTSAAGAGATAIKRTLRTADGEHDEEPAPCCACCLREDPLALPQEQEQGGDEEAPEYSAAFTITDAPATEPGVHDEDAAGSAATTPSNAPAPARSSADIDVSKPLSNNTSTNTTPTAAQRTMPIHASPAAEPVPSPLTLASAAGMAANSPVRRWAAAGRARAALPPHLRSPEAAASPSMPSGKRQLYGMEEEPPLPQPSPPARAVAPLSPPTAAGAAVEHTAAIASKRPPAAPTEGVKPSRSGLPAAVASPLPAAAVAPHAVSAAALEEPPPPVSTNSAATNNSCRSTGMFSPVADSDTPTHAAAATAATAVRAVSPPSDEAAGISSPGASSTAALQSTRSPTPVSPAAPRSGFGFGAVVAAAKLKSSRTRAQEAMQRAKQALAEVEQGVAPSSPLVRTDPVQLRLSSRGRDRSADAQLATSGPKPLASQK